jgi:hypothetical protein
MFLVWLIPCLVIGLLLIVLFLSIFRVDFRRKKVKFDRASIAGTYVSSQIGDVSAASGRKEKHSHGGRGGGRSHHDAPHVGQHHGSSTGSAGHHHSGGHLDGGHHSGGDFGGGHFGGGHF